MLEYVNCMLIDVDDMLMYVDSMLIDVNTC